MSVDLQKNMSLSVKLYSYMIFANTCVRIPQLTEVHPYPMTNLVYTVKIKPYDVAKFDIHIITFSASLRL